MQKAANKILGLISGGRLGSKSLTRFLDEAGALPKVQSFAAKRNLELPEAARQFFSKQKATMSPSMASPYVMRRRGLKNSLFPFNPETPWQPELYYGASINKPGRFSIGTYPVRNFRRAADDWTVAPKYAWNTAGTFKGLYDPYTKKIKFPDIRSIKKTLGTNRPFDIPTFVDEALAVARHEIGHRNTISNPSLGNLYTRLVLPLLNQKKLTAIPSEKRQQFLSELLAELRGNQGTTRGARALMAPESNSIINYKKQLQRKNPLLEGFESKIQNLAPNLQQRLRGALGQATDPDYNIFGSGPGL